MAYVSNMTTDEEQKTPSQGAVPPGGGAGVQLAPASGIGSTGGSPTQGAPQSGGQFASLNQYLTANQGQAQPLANKITSDIGNQYTNLQGQNTSVLNDINSQVAANATPSNYTSTLSQEAANPVSFASNPSNISSFQNLLNASYAGPASAEGTSEYTNQQNAINNAISQGQQQTTTEAGREQLLGNYETNPSTSVTGLNSAILSQSPTALNQVESAYQPFSGLLAGLSSGAQNIDTGIAQNQANANAANTAANKQIANQVNTFNTGLSNTVNQDIATQNAYNQSLQAAQTAGAPVNSALNNLNTLWGQYMGPNAETISNPFSVLNTLAPSNISYNPANVATANDYAQAAAFQNLLGNLNTGIANPLVTNATANQAGTATIPTATIPNLANLASTADTQFLVNSPLGQQLPPGGYQGIQNYQNIIIPAWNNVLQQLNKLNPSIWAPK